MSRVEKFIARLKKTPGGCWFWTGTRGGRGNYGSTSLHGRGIFAHRAAYELLVGPIPTGMWVLHKCDVGLCCNPAHLYLGTHADNTRDAVERKRMATGPRNGNYTHPERRRFGADNGMTKLAMKRKRCSRGHLYTRKYGNQNICQTCRKMNARRLRAALREEDSKP